MNLHVVDIDTLAELVLENPKIAVLYCGADWCRPCKTLLPELEKTIQECSDIADFFKIDVDQNPELTDALKVSALPTLIFFRRGQEVFRKVGPATHTQLKDILLKVNR